MTATLSIADAAIALVLVLWILSPFEHAVNPRRGRTHAYRAVRQFRVLRAAKFKFTASTSLSNSYYVLRRALQTSCLRI